MMDQPAIITEIKGKVAHIGLNRPDCRNALNMVMVEELVSSLHKVNEDENVRIICIYGKGTSFCAGADLEWMQQASRLSWDDNFIESVKLARGYHDLFNSPKVTIAAVHGAALGGAIGLIAACDLAITTDTAVFAFSEVKLGLIPATIAPFVIRKTGSNKIIEYMLTGKKFKGSEAKALGLVNRSIPEEDFDIALQGLLDDLLHTAPKAQLNVKRLIRSLTGFKPDPSIIDQTASLLAETRISDEAREGINAFLEKRQPGWNNTK